VCAGQHDACLCHHGGQPADADTGVDPGRAGAAAAAAVNWPAKRRLEQDEGGDAAHGILWPMVYRCTLHRMNVTVDTSVLLAVCTNEPSKARLIELTKECHLVAPASVHWEVGNALSAMLKRERITLDQALTCIEYYQRIPIRLVDVDLASALTFANRFRMYAYDAYLLTCSIQYNTPLITLDGALKISANQLGISTLGD